MPLNDIRGVSGKGDPNLARYLAGKMSHKSDLLISKWARPLTIYTDTIFVSFGGKMAK